jgi:2,4-dienoyl-CoA reductase-like NADH-dependent reductase (Old Yellow Enzyme family)/thioredoxin reductase
MALKMVFEPIRIGAVEIPNRVARTAHSSGMGTTRITDELIAYHEARAKGGCGLSILEACSIHRSSALTPLSLYSDTIVEDYRKLMDRIRPHGMKVFQQLWHGGNLYNGIDGSAGWAASSLAGFLGKVGRTMSEAMILEVIEGYAQCAVKAREGGLDGVEVHAAHGYLPQQFLSPLTNTRTDDWGGSFENRNRFLMETLRAIRRAAGADFALGIRLSASEMPGGVSEEDNKQVLRAVQAEGLIDYVNVSRGDYYKMDTMVSGMHSPTGYELASSADIASVGTVPRLVTGRFRTLEEIDQVIRDGLADLVSMVRQHIADPDIVRKTREGRVEEVRPCIGCNQGCWGGWARNGRFGCTVNPAAGRELELAEDLMVKTDEPKTVLVVGGGPGGLEAARTAALKGHKVILCEAGPALGGAINVAKRAPKLSTIGDIAYWLEQEVYRLGVDVRLNTYVEAADIEAIGADHVIVATGSAPRMDGVQNLNPGEPARGVEQSHVVSAIDVFTAPRDWGKSALVLDTHGDYVGLAVTEQLLGQGVKVSYVTPHTSLAPELEKTRRDGPALERFYKLGEFEVLNRTHLVEIQKDQCIVRPLLAGANQTRTVPADTVVLITHNEPLDGLWNELHETRTGVCLVGDAQQPRDVLNAIWEGHAAARAIA